MLNMTLNMSKEVSENTDPGSQVELDINRLSAFDILTSMCIAFAAALAPLVQSVRQGRPWGFYTLALVSTLWVLSYIWSYYFC